MPLAGIETANLWHWNPTLTQAELQAPTKNDGRLYQFVSVLSDFVLGEGNAFCWDVSF